MAEAISVKDEPAAQGSIQKSEEEALISDGKFAEVQGWRNKTWAVLFWAQFIAIVVVFVHFFVKQGGVNFDADIKILAHFWPILGILVVGGLIVTVCLLTVIRACSTVIVWFSILLTAIIFTACTIVSFSLGYINTGITYLVFTLLNFLYIYLIRHRIAFAVALVDIVAQCMQRYYSTIVVAIFGALLQIGWIFLWGVAAGHAYNDIQNTGVPRQLGGFLNFFLILSMFWTIQVIQNVVHVTVAGLISTWYFLFPNNTPKNPTWKSFARATTTSFGSICLGSLIVAIVQTIRAIVITFSESDNGICRACAICFLRCIESLVRYFNVYAFTQVAIYGKDYCTAARDTWELLSKAGFEAIINDDLIGSVLMFGTIGGGLIVLGISLLVTEFMYTDVPSVDQSIWAAVGFAIGFALNLCSMTVIRSGTATLFVCFAENPDALSQTKPETYKQLARAWGTRWGDTLAYPGPGVAGSEDV